MAHPICIPQRDDRAAERRAEIESQLDRYTYTWHRPEGVATAFEVPKSDGFTAHAIAQYAGVKLGLKGHDAATEVRRHLGPDEARGTPEVCAAYFGKQRPPLVERWMDHPELRDRLHAWQRIGGSNPLTIRRAAELPDAFPVTAADFARAMDATDSLDAARDEDRLYLADWTDLEGIPTGSARGEQKHVYGAWALYAESRAGDLLPVAIQCRPEPGPDAPIYTPADGARWEMARLVAQCADTHFQTLHFHLGRCHFVMEAFTLATVRRLPDRHPIKVLLRPSMEYTLAIDTSVRDDLMVPGGNMETLLAPTLNQGIERVRRSVKSFSLERALPPADIAARGTGDLACYPWREDALDLWQAIHVFAGAYLRLYYQNDGDVRGDLEVRAWAEEMGAKWGGGLGVPVPRTLGALTDLVAYVMFTAGPLHSLINYSQLDNMAFAPNMPLALYGPPPSPKTRDPELALRQLYMPEPMARLQYAFFYEQSQLRENVLGKYRPGTFVDPRAAEPVRAFEQALSEIEGRIEERNRSRLVPFTWLAPSAVRASIHS